MLTFIFDIGNVIVNYDHDKVVDQLSSYSKLSRTEVNNLLFLHSEAIKQQRLGMITSEEFYNAACEIAKLENLSYEELVKIWNGSFSPNDEMIKFIQDNLLGKYRLLIASDTNKLHFDYIKENFEVIQKFEDYFLSYELKVSKSDPEFFKKIINKYNLNPHECIYIDDRQDLIDVGGKTGLKTILYDTWASFLERFSNLKLLQ